MADEFYYEWSQPIQVIWRDTIAAATKDGLPKSEAMRIATERVNELLDNGDLKFDRDSAIRSALNDADRKDNRRAEAVLDRMFEGQDLLDFDIPNGLDVVVALGDSTQKGLRKTLGNVSVADHIAMDQLEFDNLTRVREKYAAGRPKFNRRLALLQKHGTYFDVFESGDFKSGDLDD